MCRSGNSAQRSVTINTGKELGKEWISAYGELGYFAETHTPLSINSNNNFSKIKSTKIKYGANELVYEAETDSQTCVIAGGNNGLGVWA